MDMRRKERVLCSSLCTRITNRMQLELNNPTRLLEVSRPWSRPRDLIPCTSATGDSSMLIILGRRLVVRTYAITRGPQYIDQPHSSECEDVWYWGAISGLNHGSILWCMLDNHRSLEHVSDHCRRNGYDLRWVFFLSIHFYSSSTPSQNKRYALVRLKLSYGSSKRKALLRLNLRFVLG